METTTIKALKFGVNVLKGDFIKTYPTACGLSRIDKEDDLVNFQTTYPDLEIVINRDNPWFSVFTVPVWSKRIAVHQNGVAAQLNQWGITV